MKLKIIQLISKKMSVFLKPIQENWTYSLANKIVILSTLLSISIICLRFKSLPPQIPLWYSRPWGKDILANPIWLFLMPAGSLFWHIGNMLLGIIAIPERKIFVSILFATSILITILSLLVVTNIVFIII
jgi:hypothetical protein